MPSKSSGTRMALKIRAAQRRPLAFGFANPLDLSAEIGFPRLDRFPFEKFFFDVTSRNGFRLKICNHKSLFTNALWCQWVDFASERRNWGSEPVSQGIKAMLLDLRIMVKAKELRMLESSK